MSTKVTYRGFEITVSSLDEAVALVQKLDAQSGTDKRFGQVTDMSGGTSATVARGFDPMRGTLGFLSAIAHSGREGVTAEPIAEALGVQKLKGIGVRASMVKSAIESLGFKPSEVFSTYRTSHGRFWKPEKRITEALNAAKEKAQGH